MSTSDVIPPLKSTSPSLQLETVAVAKSLASLPGPLVTRFAPSPTGRLHLGHAASALSVWGLARALGAKIILRIEDHDRGRCRPQFRQGIHEDLAWLGFEPDAGPRSASDVAPSYVQSEQLEIYTASLNELLRGGHIYACSCSRKEIEARSPAGQLDAELRYDGYCRERKLSLDGPGLSLRARIPVGVISLTDHWSGTLQQDPAAEVGDVVVRDRHGNWTYQFAVVVDDLRHGVNLVIRGRDLLSSTGRQEALRALLGARMQPAYAHHPLIVQPDGRKLSKLWSSPPLAELRDGGVAPEKVLGTAAAQAGLIREAVPLTLADFVAVIRLAIA